MFPPPKAEEGLSSQFQQIDRNNGFGNQFNNGYMGDEIENDKKGKNKKKGTNTTGGNKTNVKDKNGKNQGFDVPSTSSKQTRNNDEGKKIKKASGQTKKAK